MKPSSLTIFRPLLLASLAVVVITTTEAAQHIQPIDNRKAAKIWYRVASGYTIVDEPERTLFIDYDGGVFYNLSKETGVCRRFPLSYSGQKDTFAGAQFKKFAELTFQKEVQQKDQKKSHYSIYTVINGPQAMLHRGVVSPVLQQFGVSFTPGATTYRIDLKHAHFEPLLEMAQHNATATAGLNPLIYQLDVTHLLSRFGGVPLRRIKRSEVASFSFSLSKKEVLAELLPPGCEDL